jgi:MFS family permease
VDRVGVIGGIGLGLGYISPVSTLVKWFPDRRGVATGMAIMGFGGGAMIGAPLADNLMNQFRTPDSVGVWQTFVAMAAIYLIFMLGGVFGYKLLPAGWRPQGWAPSPVAARAMITQGHVHLRDAHKTPQFWLIWAVLCLNVSARIRVNRDGIADAARNLRRRSRRSSGYRVGAAQRRAAAHGGNDRRGICRPSLAVQHRGTDFLRVDIGLHRP